VEEIVDFVSTTEPADYDEELFRRYLRSGGAGGAGLSGDDATVDLRVPA
jgi:hypothetical protein